MIIWLINKIELKVNNSHVSHMCVCLADPMHILFKQFKVSISHLYMYV